MLFVSFHIIITENQAVSKQITSETTRHQLAGSKPLSSLTMLTKPMNALSDFND